MAVKKAKRPRLTRADKMPVPMKKWGRDHWSTLVYVETRCVDYRGVLKKEHLRCDRDRHPDHAHYGDGAEFGEPRKYPTRLRGGKLKRNHDDWDCLLDAQVEGLVEIVSLSEGIVKMTAKGNVVVGIIRGHRASGGSYATLAITEKKGKFTYIVTKAFEHHD